MNKPESPNFPPSFLLLQQEGYLIHSCLTLGLTELRNAHVHNKGAFYTALFNLSVGTERLLKAIIIIDHMLKNNLSVPTEKQLRNYGHKICDLYSACQEIGVERYSPMPSFIELGSIKKGILCLLNDFALTTRYHNLNALTKSQKAIDPLSQWDKILLLILEKDVSAKQREKILEQAHIMANIIEDITLSIAHNLDQQPLTITEALSSPRLHNQATQFAVLHVVEMLYPLHELLTVMSYESDNLKSELPPFPQMHEFTLWLWNDRQQILKKKKWP